MCYSTTKGTARKPMSFPGVVKPSPWPGLQSNSQFHGPTMARPLWMNHHHHHHHHHDEATPSEKISATTHFKVLPQQARFSPKRPRVDSTSSSSPTNVTPTTTQPPVFLFDESVPKPVPVSSEPAVSPSAQTLPPSTAGGEGGVEISANEESSAVAGTSAGTRLSPTSLAKKKRVRRRRCGSCTGCTRKENCGTCSVCTNTNNTNSVCKLKRCEVLKRRVSFVVRILGT